MATSHQSTSLVRDDYMNSLRDLKDTSKPLITHLTIIAQENSSAATSIIDAIKEFALNSPPTIKLPVVYLIDSILKNVGHPYIALFKSCITEIFNSAYSAVGVTARKSLEKVLGTWKVPPPILGPQGEMIQHKGPFFPLSVIEDMEYAVKFANSALSSNLPVQSMNTNIPNQNVLNSAPMISGTSVSSGLYPIQATFPTSAIQGSSLPIVQPNLNEAQLLAQEIQLLLLQKQQLHLLNQSDINNLNQIGALSQLLNLVLSGTLLPTQLSQIRQQLKAIMITTTPSIPSTTLASNSVQQLASVGYPSSANTVVITSSNPQLVQPADSSVFSSTNNAYQSHSQYSQHDNRNTSNIGYQNGNETEQIYETVVKGFRALDFGRIRITQDDIKRKSKRLVDIILNPHSNVCKQCGSRFPHHPPKSSVYYKTPQAAFPAHMDFHFRRNRKLKESDKRLSFRHMYPSLQDWIANTVTEVETGPTFFDSHLSSDANNSHTSVASGGGVGGKNNDKRKSSEKASRPSSGGHHHRHHRHHRVHHVGGSEDEAESYNDDQLNMVIAPEGSANLKCGICEEGFEVIWEEDEEEWMMKNAMMDGQIYYHKSCFRKKSNNLISRASQGETLDTNQVYITGKRRSEESPLLPKRFKQT